MSRRIGHRILDHQLVGPDQMREHLVTYCTIFSTLVVVVTCNVKIVFQIKPFSNFATLEVAVQNACATVVRTRAEVRHERGRRRTESAPKA